MLFQIVLLISIVVVNLFLALRVFLVGPHRKTNQYFSMVVLFVSIWILSSFFESLVTDYNLIKALVYIDFSSAVFISFLFYKFCLNFPVHLQKENGIKNVFLWSLTFLFFIFSFTKLLVAKFVFSYGGVDVEYGPLLLPYVSFLLFFFGIGFFTLLKKYGTSSGIERSQISSVFFGFIISTLGALVTYLGFPLVFKDEFFVTILPRFGTLSTVFFTGFTTYAIVKHRLMDIRLAVRAVVLKLILTLILASAFVGLVFISRLVLGEMSWANGVIIAFVFALFAALFYEPILRVIQNATDKVLFQREYSRQELLGSLGKVMTESLNFEELLKNLEEVLLKVLGISYVGFVLLKRGGEEEGEVGVEVRGFKSTAKNVWAKDNLLLEQVRVNPQILVYDELKREISEKPESLIGKRLEEVVAEMEKIEAAAAVPLPSPKGIVGMIVLGEKKSGEAFTVQDINTLETLMYQAGIAIENASLFTQIQNFNQKLSAEIAAATADLSAKNKRLLVLRRLDEIIINTLGLDEMIQKVVDVVSWEMGYLGGILFLLDEEENFRAQAVSNTPALKKAVKIMPFILGDLCFKKELDPSNLLVRALKERKPFASDNLADFFVPAISTKMAVKFQDISGMKHFVCYSLSSKGRPLGALVFALYESYRKLRGGDKSLLEAFVDQAGIAIENAKLYSDLKKANLELRRSYDELKGLDRMKDELVSISSHELRTPMTAIKSYLWMALNRTKDEFSPRARKYLNRAYESSERMINLVNDMLSVSRIDSGRLQLSIRPLNLVKLITNLVSELDLRAKEERLDLIFEKPKGEITKVLADEDKIREVLLNLLDNAMKFTPGGGKIRIYVRKRGKMVQALVEDSGPGISEKDLPKLFQKFGRLERSFATMAESGGGTGLGLYISQKIVDLHGGKIWVKSKVGKGSTFVFSLRAAE